MSPNVSQDISAHRVNCFKLKHLKTDLVIFLFTVSCYVFLHCRFILIQTFSGSLNPGDWGSGFSKVIICIDTDDKKRKEKKKASETWHNRAASTFWSEEKNRNTWSWVCITHTFIWFQRWLIWLVCATSLENLHFKDSCERWKTQQFNLLDLFLCFAGLALLGLVWLAVFYFRITPL